MTDTNTVAIDAKFPITINSTPIVALVAKSQTFRSYGEMIRGVQRAKNFNIALFREWVLHNVEARDASGTAVAFTLKDVLEFPAIYASKLQRLQRAITAPAGEIVRDGSGLDEVCIYRLGTPLKLVSSTKGEIEITELEFLVKQLGDIEAVMAGEGKFDQTIALLETCATPLGDDVSLKRLTQATIDAMTLTDGLGITELVLPRFFEPESPSSEARPN